MTGNGLARTDDTPIDGEILPPLSADAVARLRELVAVFDTPEARTDDELAEQYRRAALSPATRRAYRTDYRLFCAWALARGREPLPATSATVAAFIAVEAKAGRSVSTIEGRLAAIRMAHLIQQMDPPTTSAEVILALQGIRNTHGKPPEKKAPATVDVLDQLVASCGPDLRGRRDRAVLLLGFAGAWRRAELVAIERHHIKPAEGGITILVPNSKTDQAGEGVTIAIPRGDRLCPVTALEEWLTAAEIIEGPIFRGLDPAGTVSPRALSGQSVALIVKRRALAAGLDPADLAGHSLRAGFLTAASAGGANLFAMMDQARQKSVQTTRGYVRRGNPFEGHAGKGLL